MKNPRIYGQPPYRVALVHGGPGAAGEMAPVALELAADFGVLEPLQTKTNLLEQVEELASLLQTSADLPVTLVGFSWGAWLSILVTAHSPQAVEKLILIGSGPFEEQYLHQIHETRLSRLPDYEQREFYAILEQLDQPHGTGTSETFTRLGQLAARTDQYDPFPDTPAKQPNQSTSQGNEFHQVLRQGQELRKTGQLLSIAASIQCPVVALHGDHDPHPISGVALPLSSRLKDFRLITFDKCGHKPWIERYARDRFYLVLRQELNAI